MEAFLKKTYYDINNPAGYSSVKKLRQAALDAGYAEASYGKVRQWLLKQDTYALSKPARKHFPRAHVLTGGLDEQWTADLIDFNSIVSENDGYAYILVVMDKLSRFMWTSKMKTKRPEEVKNALEGIFESGRKPKYSIYFDKGGEFKNNIIKRFCAENNIKPFYTSNETKSSTVERAIKTIKERIYKYFLQMQFHRWVDIYSNVTHGYNNSLHRTINMLPANVTHDNEGLALYNEAISRQRSKGVVKKSEFIKEMVRSQTKENVRSHHEQVGGLALEGQSNISPTVSTPAEGPDHPTNLEKPLTKMDVIDKYRTKPIKPKFKVGDIVRISRLKETFNRAYDHQFTMELFKIVAVRKSQGLPVYKIVANEDGEDILGFFYGYELLRAYVPKNDRYRIEKVLKYRGSGPRKQAFVQWFLHPSKYNSWVPASTVKDIPGVHLRKMARKSKNVYNQHKRATVIRKRETSQPEALQVSPKQKTSGKVLAPKRHKKLDTKSSASTVKDVTVTPAESKSLKAPQAVKDAQPRRPSTRSMSGVLNRKKRLGDDQFIWM